MTGSGRVGFSSLRLLPKRFPPCVQTSSWGVVGVGAHIQPTKYSQTGLKCCKEFRRHQLWDHRHTGTRKLSFPHVPRQIVLQVQHVSAVPVLLVRFAIASFLFWFIWLRSEYLVLWVKHKKCTASSCFSYHKEYSMGVEELHGWGLEPDTQSSTSGGTSEGALLPTSCPRPSGCPRAPANSLPFKLTTNILLWNTVF